MKINIGDYLIETDERQFIVKTKKVVEEGRFTKEENIGKEYYQSIAYCTSFNSALRFVPQQVLRSNDEILVIKEKLEQIEEIIKAIPQPIEIEVEKKVEDDKVIVSKSYLLELQKDRDMLCCLEAAGVDNWDGYCYALEMMEGEVDE